jgi:hypothetical protein
MVIFLGGPVIFGRRTLKSYVICFVPNQMGWSLAAGTPLSAWRHRVSHLSLSDSRARGARGAIQLRSCRTRQRRSYDYGSG